MNKPLSGVNQDACIYVGSKYIYSYNVKYFLIAKSYHQLLCIWRFTWFFVC